jgi:hypothetical protein
MLRFIIYISVFPLFGFTQTTFSPRDLQAKAYSHAISEYLKTVGEKDGSYPDTLFVGRYEDLHTVKLPLIAGKTKIVLLKGEEEGANYLKHRQSFNYVNIVGPKSPEDNTDFIFITFIVENSGGIVKWLPKHNYFATFNYDPKLKEFKLDKVKLEYPYSNKYTERK